MLLVVSTLEKGHYDESNTREYTSPDLDYATSEMHPVGRWGVDVLSEEISAQQKSRELWTQKQSNFRCVFVLFGCCCCLDDIEQR